MQTLSTNPVENSFRKTVLMMFSLLLLFAPVALAEDEASVAALRQMGKAFAAIAEKASPAVVGIKAEKVETQLYYNLPNFPDWFFESPFGGDPFERFFGRPRSQQRPRQRELRQTAQGSGFIISSDGYILTNNHLVGEAEDVRIQLADDKELKAKVVGTDPDSDVALVKIDQDNLPFLQLGDSDALEVGEWVVAIGNPFGYSHTVTAGIVSAKGRSNIGLATYESFIQTDAAINPGNSGGPLLNLDGKVIGINTAIVTRSGGNVGIGLAIPVNMAKNVYKQLINTGTVVRGFLGIYMEDLSPDLAKAFGVKEGTTGVAVSKVEEDSPAEKAGLKHNDIIVEFDGRAVEKANKLMNYVATLKPGTKVKIVVLRDGERKTLTAELGERPKEEKTASLEESDILDKLGFSVVDMTDQLARRFGHEGLEGVIVARVEPYSVADRQGLEAGALIMEVNREPVRDTKQFNEQINKAAEGGSILLRVKQGRFIHFVALPVPVD